MEEKSVNEKESLQIKKIWKFNVNNMDLLNPTLSRGGVIMTPP